MDDLYEFSPPGWFARVRNTPLSEALRGGWSGRLDPRAEIAAAGLPSPLPSLIYTVARRSRLWRREQCDVARELIAHFADGLAAGRSPEDLARAFGSPKQAARLIRRGKLRSRPLAWQVCRLVTQISMLALVTAIVGYSCWSARFYLGHPVVAHNYWNEINEARRVAEADRAWPLYREALFKLGRDDAKWIDTEKIAQGPESADWKRAAATIERHRDVFELIRAGAKKPSFGYYLGDPAEVTEAQAVGAEWLVEKSMPLAEKNGELISAFLSGPQRCRMLARMLIVDARLAAAAGDGATVAADLTALIGLAEQLFPPDGTLVEQLIGMAVFGVTMETTGRIVADTPSVLDDGRLRDLAHRIAAFRGGKMSVDFNGERMLFEDILQRSYTDDGHGDGRFTSEGMAVAASLADNNFLRAASLKTAGDRQTAIAAALLGPALASLIGSRQENRELYHSIMDEMIALHQDVPWKWDRPAIDASHNRLDVSGKSVTGRSRHFLVMLLLPGIDAVFNAAERATQQRDAAEVAIALVIWHRRHGQWPENLQQLVPDLLPAVPPDRLDGQPIRYVVRDGQPVVYSIGNNRRDDGGHPTARLEEALPHGYGPLTPERLQMYQSSDYAGDWILWPPLPEEVEQDDASASAK